MPEVKRVAPERRLMVAAEVPMLLLASLPDWPAARPPTPTFNVPVKVLRAPV